MAVLRFSSEIRAQTSSSSPFIIAVLGREQGLALLPLPYTEVRAGEGSLAPSLSRAAPGSLPWAQGNALLQAHDGAWQSQGPAWLGTLPGRGVAVVEMAITVNLLLIKNTLFQLPGPRCTLRWRRVSGPVPSKTCPAKQ